MTDFPSTAEAAPEQPANAGAPQNNPAGEGSDQFIVTMAGLIPLDASNWSHPDRGLAAGISALLACGFKQVEICAYFRISTKTLHEHYKDAIERGALPVFGMVGSKIVAAAQSSEPWALKHISKCRMGWTERLQVEEAPPPPPVADHVSDIDRILSAATPEELDLIDALLSRAAAGEPRTDAGEDPAPAPAQVP